MKRFAKVLEVDVDFIKELDTPVINITHNHGENDNSINGHEITIKLPRNILDVFQSILNDSVSISFTEPNRPIIIKGIQDNNFLYLLMPTNR